jgi:uncharacterized protein
MLRHSIRLVGMTVVILCALLCAAEPINSLHPTAYVNDFAGALTPETKSQLEALATEVDQKAQAQIAVVTIKSLDGDDVDDYAVNLFKAWGIGGKKSDRGVLILAAIQDRKYRIEVGYGLEPILPDGKVGGFGREAVPLFRANNYSGALNLMTTRVAQTIATDAHVQLTGVQNLPPQQPHVNVDFPWWLPFLGIFIIIQVIRFFLRLVGIGGRRGGGGFWIGPGPWIGGGFGGGGGSGGGGGASGRW